MERNGGFRVEQCIDVEFPLTNLHQISEISEFYTTPQKAISIRLFCYEVTGPATFRSCCSDLLWNYERFSLKAVRLSRQTQPRYLRPLHILEVQYLREGAD